MSKNEVDWEEQARRYKAEVVTLQKKHDDVWDKNRHNEKKIVELLAQLNKNKG